MKPYTHVPGVQSSTAAAAAAAVGAATVPDINLAENVVACLIHAHAHASEYADIHVHPIDVNMTLQLAFDFVMVEYATDGAETLVLDSAMNFAVRKLHQDEITAIHCAVPASRTGLGIHSTLAMYDEEHQCCPGNDNV